MGIENHSALRKDLALGQGMERCLLYSETINQDFITHRIFYSIFEDQLYLQNELTDEVR